MREWLQAAPLTHALKQVRNDIVNNSYCSVKPQALEPFLQAADLLQGQTIAAIVAFNQPWSLDWLFRMASRYMADTPLLVFDNSNNKDHRLTIESLCRKREILYFPLPRNPEYHPCRSHGIALTWIYHNVITKIKPHTFAFIDHDLIPLAKIDFDELLGDQPFYGRSNIQPFGCSLWAGYCMYDFSAVAPLPLNFNNDISRRLDTGGRNWKCLYSRYDFSQLRLAEDIRPQITLPNQQEGRTVQVIDKSWLHLGGASYCDSFKSNLDFFHKVAELTDNGIGMKELMTPS